MGGLWPTIRIGRDLSVFLSDVRQEELGRLELVLWYETGPNLFAPLFYLLPTRSEERAVLGVGEYS